jgi:hypothetical protein
VFEVNPLPAKAGSFFGQPAQRRICVQRARSRLGKRSAQNIARSVCVSVQDKPANTAVVDPFRKFFRHDLATTAALLTCPAGIDLDHFSPGSRSLGLQYADKSGPADISNRLGESVVPQHPLDVEAFHSNQPIAIKQKIRNFVYVFPTLSNGLVSFTIGDNEGVTRAITRTSFAKTVPESRDAWID